MLKFGINNTPFLKILIKNQQSFIVSRYKHKKYSQNVENKQINIQRTKGERFVQGNVDWSKKLMVEGKLNKFCLPKPNTSPNILLK